MSDTLEKAAHTPGPWTYTPTAVGIYAAAFDRVVPLPCESEPERTFREGLVALPYACGESFNVVANARLIAAAPELLAALKDLRAMVIGEHGVSAYENINGERADAAIAKAEGRDA